MDTLQSLRHFAEAVRVGSLSAAARELGVSPATVSRSIDNLERQLGFSLMAKTSRSLGLTDAGAAYLPRVQRVLSELDEATAIAKGLHSEPKGELRVHTRVAVGNICISPLLPEFLRRHDEIGISLTMSNDTSIDLLKNNIDVDIRTGVLQDSSLIARKLADSKRIIVASPDYLARRGVPETPDDLREHNCIVFRNNPNQVVWKFRDSEGRNHAILPKGNLETDTGEVIRRALLGHVGIGHMTDWSVREELQSGRLVQILQDFDVTVDDFNHGIYAVFMPSRSQCRKVRAFLDFLVESFRQQAYFDGTLARV